MKRIQLITPQGLYISSTDWDEKSPVGLHVSIGDPVKLPAQFVGGGWQDADIQPTDVPMLLVSQNRFLDLLGDAVSGFFGLLDSDNSQLKTLGRVAEARFYASSEIDLSAPVLLDLLVSLVAVGVLTQDHADAIKTNTVYTVTDEQA